MLRLGARRAALHARPRHHAPACIGKLLATSSAADASAGDGDLLALPLFHTLAERALEGVQDVAEEFADADPEERMEVEFSGDVLEISVRAGGTFVLNKQTPNRQLWLSSPVSGPLRYNFDVASATWRNARDNETALTATLADDLEQLLGERLSFDQVEAELRELAAAGGS